MEDFSWVRRKALDEIAEQTECSRLLSIIEGQLRELRLRKPRLEDLRKISEAIRVVVAER